MYLQLGLNVPQTAHRPLERTKLNLALEFPQRRRVGVRLSKVVHIVCGDTMTSAAAAASAYAVVSFRTAVAAGHDVPLWKRGSRRSRVVEQRCEGEALVAKNLVGLGGDQRIVTCMWK